jgi:acyl-CoA synthetase (AMP-forming)/AMP-acid ligase II
MAAARVGFRRAPVHLDGDLLRAGDAQLSVKNRAATPAAHTLSSCEVHGRSLDSPRIFTRTLRAQVSMALLYDWLQAIIKDHGGGGTALVYRDTYLSWRGLAHRADRRVQELTSFGVGPGTWIGVMLGNVPELVILAAAASKLGAVLVPLDPTTASRELDMILEAAPLRALITRPHGGDSPTPAPLSPARGDGRRTGPRHEPEGRRRLQGTLLNVHLYRRQPVELSGGITPSVVLFTADAGGDPKGVVRSEAQLAAIAELAAIALDIEPEERVLNATAMHHSFGFDVGLLGPLYRGATLYLEDEVSVKRLGKLLRDERIDMFPGTPGLFGVLSREVAVKPVTTKRARFVSSGAPLPRAVADAFFERYKVRLLSAYHTTETGPLTLDRAGKEPGTVGKPLDGVELRLAGPGGEAPATGQPAAVWARSPGAASIFVPELTVPLRGSVPIGRSDSDGWLRTGDLGSFDKAGRLILAGREDDVVKIDGKRVALGEVAGCLESFSKVRAAEARVAVDDFGGQIVVARVVASGGCRADELIDHCARNLPPYKVPRQIEFCEEL